MVSLALLYLSQWSRNLAVWPADIVNDAPDALTGEG